MKAYMLIIFDFDGTLADSDDLAVSWEGNDEYMQWGGRGWSSQPGQAGYDAPFNGTISDKEIYGVVLTADEIADLHADGPPNADPVALDDTLVVAEDGSGSLDPAANDSDADVGDVDHAAAAGHTDLFRVKRHRGVGYDLHLAADAAGHVAGELQAGVAVHPANGLVVGRAGPTLDA